MRGGSARIAYAVLAALALAAPVLAQSGAHTIDVTFTGSVDRACVLESPQVNLGNATNVSQVAGTTVTIANLSDEQSLTTKAADFTASFGGACNFGHQITVSSDRGGLWRQPAGTLASGFANAVPYRATINWGGSEATLLAAATGEATISQQMSIDGAAGGDVQLHFHIDDAATNAGTGAPLVSGVYEDTIRVTLGPL